MQAHFVWHNDVSLANQSPASLLQLLGFLLTLVPGLLATLVWFILVDRIGAVRASTYHFLNPFFGVAIAAAILREGLSTLDILGVAIVAGGILAVQLAKRS